MNLLRQNRYWLFAVLVMVFFVWARAGSVAHALNYGTAPHNHDSKICVFSVLTDEEQDDLALPPAHITLTIPVYNYSYLRPPVQTVWPVQAITQTARAPPGQ